MIEVLATEDFTQWLRRLKDRQGKLRILERVDRLRLGNPGDSKHIGGGVHELRVRQGPGYRVYYLCDGAQLVLLLCGGNKSTQQRDIKRARRLAKEWRTEEDDDGH